MTSFGKLVANISVPARPAHPESAAGKPAQSESEALASQLAKDQDFSVAACQRLLALVKFKKDATQRSVVQGKKSKSEYIILGVYARGGVQGITRKSDDHPKLTEYLCRFLKHLSSICINHGSSVKVYKDIHNKTDATNVTMSLGDFQGGELWVHDEGLGEGDQHAVKRRLPDGNFAYGRISEVKGKLITFDPKSFHRWSITAYVNRACHKLQNEERERLSRLGFVLPSKASVPAPPKTDPDDDLTLFEFAESDKTTPKAVEPRVKPKVKLKAEPKRKTEKKSSAPEPPVEEPLPEDADYIRKLVEEGRADDEGEAPSSASRPPGGEAGIPDEGAKPEIIPPPPELPGGSEAKRSRSIESLKKEAKSAKHLLTHIPKNPYSEICKQAKMYKIPGYAGAGTTVVEAKEFGDHITADHVVLHRDSKNVIEEARLALVVKDVATSFMYAYPSALKSEEDCHLALTHFVSHKDAVGQFYSDNAQELIKSVKSLRWRHELSKAYVHQSNAIAERAVRATTEGTRTNLLQAGLSCSMFNLDHPNGLEYTPWFKRFGATFPGKILPFGCRVDYWLGPKAKRAKEGLDRFAPTSEPGVFLGYHFQPGMKWKKEIYVLSLKDLNKRDFNECLQPIKASNFTIPDGDFVFPMKDRYDKVRSGGASDALELPQGQSLENQDAQEQPEPEGSDEPSRERSALVLDPSSGKLVPIPSGGKYYDAGGTLGRRYTGGRGSRKPDDIPSYLGVNMSKKQKDQAVQDALRVKRQWNNSSVKLMLKRIAESCQVEVQAAPRQPLSRLTKISGKSGKIRSFDIIVFLEGICSPLTSPIAQFQFPNSRTTVPLRLCQLEV